MKWFDCSDLFPGYDSADASVKEDRVIVRVWSGGTYALIEMVTDKIASFLDECRRQ